MMPQDNRPRVYLCGSIGNQTIGQALAWREEAERLLAPDFEVINPMREFVALGPEARSTVLAASETARRHTDAEIVRRDLRDIRMSSLVLRHYRGPSEGSPMECFYATSIGVPVVVSGIDDPATASPWLRYHSVRILPTIAEAVAYMKGYWSIP